MWLVTCNSGWHSCCNKLFHMSFNYAGNFTHNRHSTSRQNHGCGTELLDIPHTHISGCSKVDDHSNIPQYRWCRSILLGVFFRWFCRFAFLFHSWSESYGFVWKEGTPHVWWLITLNSSYHSPFLSCSFGCTIFKKKRPYGFTRLLTWEEGLWQCLQASANGWHGNLPWCGAMSGLLHLACAAWNCTIQCIFWAYQRLIMAHCLMAYHNFPH